MKIWLPIFVVIGAVIIYLTKPSAIDSPKTVPIQLESTNVGNQNNKKTDTNIEPILKVQQEPEDGTNHYKPSSDSTRPELNHENSLNLTEPSSEAPWPNTKNTAEMDRHFYQQAYDSSWASGQEVNLIETITEVFITNGLSNELKKVECRTNACRIELNQSLQNEYFNDVLESLYDRNEEGLAKAISIRQTQAGNTLIYVSRKHIKPPL